MSSSQHSQLDIGASSHPIGYLQDLSSVKLGETAGQRTPQASTSLDSGSTTETESSKKKAKKAQSKGKEKEKEKGKAREQDKDKTKSKEQQQQQQKQNNSMLSSRSGRAPTSGRRQPSKGKAKTDDWSDVTDPEERRRIQNRIAQRKFREKAREQKERAERDLRNYEHAGSSYQVPGPHDLAGDDELSGVPWGGPSLRFVVAKGHESLSNQGSRRASDYLTDETATYAMAGGSSNSSRSRAEDRTGDSGRAATEAASWADSPSVAAEAEAAGYGYGDDGQLYSITSGDDSQGGSSRSSSDYTYPPLTEDSQYFDESPYYYD